MKTTNRCGFTLVELLICVSIILIICGAFAGMIDYFNRGICHAHELSMAEDVNETALGLWRTDVLAAQKIELINQPQNTTPTMMRMTRADGTSVFWQRGVDPEKIERRIESSDPDKFSIQVFHAWCVSLEFAALENGRAYTMTWTGESNDGIRTFRHGGSALAAPLNAFANQGGPKK